MATFCLMSNHKPNDYEPVVFRTPVARLATVATRTKAEKELQRDDGEIPQLRYMDPAFVHRVVAARIARQWTRQMLATQLCVRESVVAELESGGALHNGPLVAKLKRTLALV
jgi:ribosome-binding protein aMBF1 (putative translation factor)